MDPSARRQKRRGQKGVWGGRGREWGSRGCRLLRRVRHRGFPGQPTAETSATPRAPEGFSATRKRARDVPGAQRAPKQSRASAASGGCATQGAAATASPPGAPFPSDEEAGQRSQRPAPPAVFRAGGQTRRAGEEQRAESPDGALRPGLSKCALSHPRDLGPAGARLSRFTEPPVSLSGPGRRLAMEGSALLLLINGSAPGRNESGGGGGQVPVPEAPSEVDAAWGWSGASLASQALLLLLIFALSALGNGAVVVVIARHRPLRTVTNAFVLSLSLSELLGAALCLPPALASLLSGRPHGAWLFGPRLCLASAAAHAGLGIAATLTMALLSFDRYCAIVRQPRRKMGRRRAAQLLAAVWLAALGFSGPWYLLGRREDEEEEEEAGPEAYHCMYALPWGSSSLGPPYGAALIVLCYLLPFALMCFCHYNICRAVRRSESRVRPLTTYGHLLRYYGEMRTATTVLIMIVSIICCWGPYCVLGLAAATGHVSFSPAVDTVACWMAWANGAINPLIYAARNPNIAMLLGRNREGGYRTRGNVAAVALAATQGRRLEGKSRAERYASHGSGGTVGSTLTSSSPASGGELGVWACRNPALLFCRDGWPDTASEGGLQQGKTGAADTSL
ncbi:G-protein coupled receptor 135 [Podarcis raffonei]|uniref:G-protein coupled receptor 135 n=1 Tax=Podarcis raffonei TaxID=65483 RepID=UPI0023291A17|nr:G-protein coupled receptor 135 [Podarcis raffonei]